MMWSPSTTAPVWSTAISRSASPSRARPRSAPSATHGGGERRRGRVAPQPALMLRPSGWSWIATTSAPAAASSGPAMRAGGPVGGVDDDAQPVEAAAVEGGEDVVAGRPGCPRRRAAGPGRRSAAGRAHDLALDALLDVVGELRPAAGEQLDAVVAVRVVRRRDHRAEASRRAASKATTGVGTTPRRWTTTPSLASPATNAASSIAVDTRVSPPTTASTPAARSDAGRGAAEIEGERRR